MKYCTKCEINKNESEFHKSSRNKDGLQRYCKNCKKILGKVYFQENQQALTERYAAQRGIRKQAYYGAIKGSGLQCGVCSEDDFACLEFHHIDPSIKEKMISELVSSHSWERITTELKKCVVVCKNCHAKIHHYADFVSEGWLNDNRYDIKYGIPKKPR